MTNKKIVVSLHGVLIYNMVWNIYTSPPHLHTPKAITHTHTLMHAHSLILLSYVLQSLPIVRDSWAQQAGLRPG